MSSALPRQVCKASTSTLRPAPVLSSSKRRLSTSPTTHASISSTLLASPSSSSSTKPTLTPKTRTYTSRKSFLFSHYAHLLRNSSAVLVFQHNNLSSRDLTNVRKALGGVGIPKGLLSKTQSGDQSVEDREKEVKGLKAGFVIARTGVLAAVVQEQEKLARIASIRARAASRPTSSSSSSSSSSPKTPESQPNQNSILPLLSGPIALLTLPTLSPTYIRSLLSALNKTFSFRPPTSSAYANVTESKPVSVPSQLTLLGALLEPNAPATTKDATRGKLLSTSQLVHLSEHTPELSELHAQLVGLLSSGGAGLVGVLGSAGGGGLVRTLMGLEEGLREKDVGVEPVDGEGK